MLEGGRGWARKAMSRWVRSDDGLPGILWVAMGNESDILYTPSSRTRMSVAAIAGDSSVRREIRLRAEARSVVSFALDGLVADRSFLLRCSGRSASVSRRGAGFAGSCLFGWTAWDGGRRTGDGCPACSPPFLPLFRHIFQCTPSPIGRDTRVSWPTLMEC